MKEDQIHGYKIETIIQENENSRVLQAYSGNDLVVLKVGNSHQLGEATILMQLEHPNIISVLHHFLNPEVVVMPFVHGLHFSDYLEHSPPSFPIIQQLFTDLVSAVAHIHSKGFLHCDLNSPNILVDHAHFLTLIDFGLSRPIRQAHLQRKIIGSTRSSPPELKEGSVWTEKGEIYSLGVLLSDLLNASTDEIPEHWQQLLYRCTHRNPNERPQNAAVLLSEIEETKALLAPPQIELSLENDTPEVSKILIAMGVFALLIGILIGIIISV